MTIPINIETNNSQNKSLEYDALEAARQKYTQLRKEINQCYEFKNLNAIEEVFCNNSHIYFCVNNKDCGLESRDIIVKYKEEVSRLIEQRRIIIAGGYPSHITISPVSKENIQPKKSSEERIFKMDDVPPTPVQRSYLQSAKPKSSVRSVAKPENSSLKSVPLSALSQQTHCDLAGVAALPANEFEDIFEMDPQ